MKESFQLKRAWFGGYNRQDVQDYLDDLHTDMESKYNDLHLQAETINQENQLLLEYINDTQSLDDSMGGINLNNAFDNQFLFSLPEGAYQIGDNQQIRSLSDGHSKSNSSEINLEDIKQLKQVHEVEIDNGLPEIQERVPLTEEKDLQVTQATSAENHVKEQVETPVSRMEDYQQYSTKPTSKKKVSKFSTDERVAKLEQEVLELKAKLAFANDLLKDLYKQ